MENSNKINSNQSCNCLLGLMKGDRVYRNNITYRTKVLLNVHATFSKWRSGTEFNLDIVRLLDEKNGYFVKFNFCPNCGNEILWNEIIEEIKNSKKD